MYVLMNNTWIPELEFASTLMTAIALRAKCLTMIRVLATAILKCVKLVITGTPNHAAADASQT